MIFINLVVGGSSYREISSDFRVASYRRLVFEGYHRGIMAITYDELINFEEVIAITD